MIGGRNYHVSQFNLATQGERQPGSAFKPFVLAAALRDGISPGSTMVSHPVVIDAGGRAWSVTNFEHNSLGPVDLSKAIAYSDNTVFAQLTNLVGPANVVAAAKQMGITTPLNPYFSIGLGAEPATPLEMARAYATLANGGYRLDGSIFGNQPRAVQSVTLPSKNGTPPVLMNYPEPQALDWLTNGNAAIEDQMLRGVVQYGTGTAAQLPGYEVAGKTGTTENYGDAWFVGFTHDVVTAVWVGYPNSLVPMLHEYHGHTVEGGTFPALIWKEFMSKALPYLKLTNTTIPSAPVPYASPARVIFRDKQARARQRQLPGGGNDGVLQRQGADDGRQLQAERGRGAERPRRDARCGPGATDRPAARVDGLVQGRDARQARRARRLAGPGERDALGVRQGSPRRLACGLRSRAAARRDACGEGPRGAREATAARSCVGRGGRPGGLAEARLGRRGGAGNARRAHREALNGLLTKRDPARP